MNFAVFFLNYQTKQELLIVMKSSPGTTYNNHVYRKDPKFATDISIQTVETKFRLLLRNWSVHGLHSCHSIFAYRWSGGAMMLGKLPVPGRHTNLDNSRVRAYCACSRCGWGLFGHFFSSMTSLLSPTHWETVR